MIAANIPADAQTSTGKDCRALISDAKNAQATYRTDETRHAAHLRAAAAKEPMLLMMADGSVVNLSDEAELSKPHESWTVARDMHRKANTAVKEAEEMLAKNDEAGCVRLLEPFEWNRS